MGQLLNDTVWRGGFGRFESHFSRLAIRFGRFDTRFSRLAACFSRFSENKNREQ